MPARQFNYYDDWKNTPLTCPKCGWKGTFEEGDVEYYEELVDCSCPQCSYPDAQMLAIVSYPTMEETKENWSKLSDSERADYEYQQKFHEKYERLKLRGPDQLPEVSEATLVCQWDFDTDESGANWTLIRNGEQVLWKEPAVYEGYERFEAVAKILKSKYSNRFIDLEPTDASGPYLYGDKLSSIQRIKDFRLEINGDEPLGDAS